MKKYILVILLIIPVVMQAQRQYTEKEINRIAELGKLWGILHNFHPSMARNIINTDSLITDVAADLANDPSAANLKTCLIKMLGRLQDPLTHVVEKNDTPVKLFTTNDSIPSYRLLADSILYVAFPTNFAIRDTVVKLDWLQPKKLALYKGVILDLRKAKEDGYGEYMFIQNMGDLYFRSMLKKQLQMPTPLFRYQAGFGDQNNRTLSGNVYSAGWQTAAPDIIEPANETINWRSPVVIVINRFVSGDLLQSLLTLQMAGYCKIVFDGKPEEYNNGSTIDYMTDTDSIYLKLRVMDYIDAAGNQISGPDLLIDVTKEENTFIEKCRILALPKKAMDIEKVASLNYIHPFPTDNYRGLAPVGARLFALYNYWNAIAYFNPNKHLLKQSWDSVLTEFIPRFIRANDTASYYFTIRDMVSRIHDSHGFFGKTPDMKVVTEGYRYTPPLSVKRIEGRYYIVAIGKDSLQKLADFGLWDEIVAIDDIPVNKYKEKFRSRFAASNEWTFERDMCNIQLLRGAKYSSINLTVLRNGKSIKLKAMRTLLDYYSDYKLVSFNDDHRDIELLKGNIGYVNMGSLQGERVEKLFDTLINTKAIIFDIRNYPRGTAWSIVPRLTDHDSIAVKFGKPNVTFSSIYSQPAIMNNTEFFTVVADKSKPYYKGKIIMLCDAETQSQAEYNIMMFQGAAGKRVTVIGSPTAGADGNVTAISLPGGYTTYFSGLEVLYPDGAQTQQKGIRINIKKEPTAAGLKAGKDELLDRALLFIETGK